MSFLHFLAQTTQPTAPLQPVPWYFNVQQFMLPLLIGVVFLFIFSSSKTKKNEAKQREEMLNNLKRGDRVQTIGGVFGTVVDARENDVVLKVDESSNTKIKFAREAIKRVVTDEDTAPAK